MRAPAGSGSSGERSASGVSADGLRPAEPDEPGSPAGRPAPQAPGGASHDPGAETVSLEGLHASVPVPPRGAGFWSQWKAFVGPALLVSVGYMDPGNWGTDLAAGARFKYGLLWVVALSSAMAVVLQVASARLGIVSGRDLAQCCREWYPRWTRWPLWLLGELAIAACDLAEVLGSAVALNLLFHIPLLWAVIVTAADVLLLLALQRVGMRMIEALVLVLVGTIAACFAVEVLVLPQVAPSVGEMGRALLHPGLGSPGMAYLAIGIIGATVMPHNLYLHSALVQSRQVRRDDASIRTALRFNTIDAVTALALAFLVNAAIVVLAGTVFFGHDRVAVAGGEVVTFGADADWIRVAYLTLAPLLGTAVASFLFVIALLASGQSSTVTGTLAGQVVMEGFMRWRLAPWTRRMITRLLAVVPAVVVVGVHGEGSVTDLLTLSQVVLALQLPFAMVPLLQFTGSRRRMGAFRSGRVLMAAGWACAAVIIGMDLIGLPDSLRSAWLVLAGR